MNIHLQARHPYSVIYSHYTLPAALQAALRTLLHACDLLSDQQVYQR